MEGGDDMKKEWIITIVLVVVVGVGAFFGGMQYQKMQRNTFFAEGTGMMQNGGQRFFRAGGNGNGSFGNMRPVRGEIISNDDNSITVKMSDGSTKIIVVSAKTIISQATTGSKNDLQQGKQVLVIGTQNSDGSVTAQDIQINPQTLQMMRGGTPQPTK